MNPSLDKPAPVLSSFVALLSLLGVAFSTRFLLVGGENEGFTEFPAVTFAHVAPGLVYLALAPLQFLKSIRSNYPGYHRWTGRLLVGIGFIAGAAALFIGLVFPYSGLPEQIVITVFGVFYLLSLAKGFTSARNKHFKVHREWMIRAYSIGLSIVTMRLIFIPILIWIGDPTREEAELYSIVSFSLSFFIHSAFAEYWIRRTRVN